MTHGRPAVPETHEKGWTAGRPRFRATSAERRGDPTARTASAHPFRSTYSVGYAVRMMSLTDIVAEMQRSADVEYLLRWIQERSANEVDGYEPAILSDIHDAVTAYFEVLEEL